jgi:ADP-ribose 1''-phosphate phosphatase
MSLQRDPSIKSFFQPTGEGKGKRKSECSVSLPSTPDKRTTSISPPPTKRRNTETTIVNQAGHLDYTDLPSDWFQATSLGARDPQRATRLQLTYHQGDLLQAPEGALLIHACNAKGVWGTGIAKAFKSQYPQAYATHHAFCVKDHKPSHPVPTGTTQLLAPCDTQRHWIGCLFTSAKYGKAKDKPELIVRNTVEAMQMLLELVSRTEGITVIRMCKINSGKFGVPWKKTAEALTGLELKAHWRTSVEVWEPRD